MLAARDPRLRIVLVSALTLCSSLLCTAEVGAAPATMQPSDTDATLLCFTDKWAVWEVGRLDPATRGNVVQTFDFYYYLQELKNAQATLVHARRDSPGEALGTITAHGTFVLGKSLRPRLSWHAPGAESAAEEPEHHQLLNLYPDGALFTMRDWSKPETKPLEIAFVPFAGRRLELQKRVELIAAGDETLGRFEPREAIQRHQQQFAMFTFHFDARNPPAGGRQASLYLFDLQAKAGRLIRLDKQLESGFQATAFDGARVVAERRIAWSGASGAYVLDLQTRAFTPLGRHVARPVNGIFVMRHNIGYFVRDGALYAADLASNADELPVLRLADAPRQVRCAHDDAGVIVWNGRTWSSIPWLKKWP